MDFIQGDTAVIAVKIYNADGSQRDFNSQDTVKFGLAGERNTSSRILSKTMSYDNTSQEYTVELTPAETAALTADERYWFDIGLKTSAGKYYRVVPCTPVWIVPAVTEVD